VRDTAQKKLREIVGSVVVVEDDGDEEPCLEEDEAEAPAPQEHQASVNALLAASDKETAQRAAQMAVRRSQGTYLLDECCATYAYYWGGVWCCVYKVEGC
jgi:hypothetical protein